MLEPVVPKKSILNIINYILLAVQAAASIALSLIVIKLNIIPRRYMVIISIILVALLAINLLLLKWKPGRIISCILSAIVITSLCFGGNYAYRTKHMLDRITSVDTEKYNINIYVKSDDKAQTVNEAGDYTFGILKEIDRENTDTTVSKIEKTLDKKIRLQEYDGVTDLIDALLNGKTGAVILNEGYISALAGIEGHEDIEEKIKAIYINNIVVEPTPEPIPEPDQGQGNQYTPIVRTPKNITQDSFVVYLSGIDTRGSAIINTRSDVNILMVVNPINKEILLVNTPRDYYVPLSISKGVRDKLTHAGIYGVNVSMRTLEMLYGVQVDYYVRINFTSFVKIIDALGGVDVYSDYSFNVGSYSYEKGYNSLMGDEALAFSRERHSFSGGDRQRGKNQMAVINAVINKLTSSAVLTNYNDIMNSVMESIQTSISSGEITSLVKMQINDMASWSVSSCSVDGTGANNYTYSMPKQKAYVMVPNEATVNAAKEKIDQVMGN